MVNIVDTIKHNIHNTVVLLNETNIDSSIQEDLKDAFICIGLGLRVQRLTGLMSNYIKESELDLLVSVSEPKENEPCNISINYGEAYQLFGIGGSPTSNHEESRLVRECLWKFFLSTSGMENEG